MATNDVPDAGLNVPDSGMQPSFREQLRDAVSYEQPNHYAEKQERAGNWTSRNSNYDAHRSHYGGHLQPRASHRSNHDGHNHRKFIPNLTSDAYYRQETYPRWNTYQSTFGHLGFSGNHSGFHGHLKRGTGSTEYAAKDFAETEKQRARNWTSRNNSYDRQVHRRADHRDFIAHPSLPDAYRGHATYPRRNISQSTVESFGFPVPERSNTYYSYGVGSYSLNTNANAAHVPVSSSELSRKGTQPYRSHKYRDAAPRSAVNDKSSRHLSAKRPAYPKRAWETEADLISDKGRHADLASSRSPSFKQLKEKSKTIKVEHLSEKAVEGSCIGDKKSVEETLVSSKNTKEKSGSEIAKNDCLALEKNVKVSHLLIPREPAVHRNKKLLVLDLNGLLADIVHPPPQECKADATLARRAIFTRPYCDDFLKFCFEKFEVGIWSSRTKKIIDRVVDYLLGDMKNRLLFCWDQSHCTGSGFRTLENEHKELLFKELRKIWEAKDPLWGKGEYNESNTLLLDDSPYKALLNPMHTAIFPCSYSYMDPYDNSLGPGGDLLIYLQKLAAVDNVQKYVEGHPFGQMAIDETHSSWDFYRKVLSSLSKEPSKTHMTQQINLEIKGAEKDLHIS